MQNSGNIIIIEENHVEDNIKYACRLIDIFEIVFNQSAQLQNSLNERNLIYSLEKIKENMERAGRSLPSSLKKAFALFFSEFKRFLVEIKNEKDSNFLETETTEFKKNLVEKLKKLSPISNLTLENTGDLKEATESLTQEKSIEEISAILGKIINCGTKDLKILKSKITYKTKNYASSNRSGYGGTEEYSNVSYSEPIFYPTNYENNKRFLNSYLDFAETNSMYLKVHLSYIQECNDYLSSSAPQKNRVFNDKQESSITLQTRDINLNSSTNELDKHLELILILLEFYSASSLTLDLKSYQDNLLKLLKKEAIKSMVSAKNNPHDPFDLFFYIESVTLSTLPQNLNTPQKITSWYRHNFYFFYNFFPIDKFVLTTSLSFIDRIFPQNFQFSESDFLGLFDFLSKKKVYKSELENFYTKIINFHKELTISIDNNLLNNKIMKLINKMRKLTFNEYDTQTLKPLTNIIKEILVLLKGSSMDLSSNTLTILAKHFSSLFKEEKYLIPFKDARKGYLIKVQKFTNLFATLSQKQEVPEEEMNNYSKRCSFFYDAMQNNITEDNDKQFFTREKLENEKPPQSFATFMIPFVSVLSANPHPSLLSTLNKYFGELFIEKEIDKIKINNTL